MRSIDNKRDEWYTWICNSHYSGNIYHHYGHLSSLRAFSGLHFLMTFFDCIVLGVVREYAIISLLVNLVCLGTHLLILTTNPKCLQVINEVKIKRYKIIQNIHFIVSFSVPFIFLVPWPFIHDQYGNQLYLCWLCEPGGSGGAWLSTVFSCGIFEIYLFGCI